MGFFKEQKIEVRKEYHALRIECPNCHEEHEFPLSSGNVRLYLYKVDKVPNDLLSSFPCEIKCPHCNKHLLIRASEYSYNGKTTFIFISNKEDS